MMLNEEWVWVAQDGRTKLVKCEDFEAISLKGNMGDIASIMFQDISHTIILLE